jgi:hypothetical protein
MTTSADLGIYYLAGQQAQPEIIHNSALNQFQVLLSGVISVGLNTPPGSPAQGDTYILGASPTGAWAGRANCLAGYFGTAWVFVPGNTSAGTPITMGVRQEGLRVWNKTDDKTYVWSGSAWSAIVLGMANPMTTAGDIITGGASGTPGRLGVGTNGFVLTVVAGAVAWAAASGGSQSGMASAAATLNDFPFYTGVGGYTSATLNSATRLHLNLVYLDSPLTFTDIVIAVRTGSAATSIDIGIYNFLGAGKPGTCVASANLSTASSGRVAVTLGAPVTINPGLYWVAMHGSVSPSLAMYSQVSANVPGQIAGLAISDAMTQIAAGTTTLSAVLFNDASLPGGSYSRGMDLTGLNMTSANIVGYNTAIPVVALKKQ